MSDFVQSLDRGIAVIRSFSAATPRQTLSDVSRETGLTRATARRLLLTLESLGYVRSDGCGIVVLKRLSDAKKNGDRIFAVIRGSAMSQDGHSSGLTVPNGKAQIELIKEALQRARVEPSQVSYLEAHGTGTSLGDPIEMRSINTVFANGR